MITGTVTSSATVTADTSVSAPAKRKKPGSTTPAVCDPSATTPNAFVRARHVFVELRNAGYSPGAAAGVVGVLDFRSALAPYAISQDSTSYGIAQWPVERWQEFTAYTESTRVNRWSPKRQVLWLIEEMAAGPETFDSAGFATTEDAGEAARTFRQTYFPAVAEPESLDAMASRAEAWLGQLKDVPLTPVDPAKTNGITVPCAPASGAALDRCPMVPDSYKDAFRSFTGFSWERMDSNAQMMTRCAYNNFPYIQSHGTYNGHSPNWTQAIDFFMPYGCTYSGGRAVTRNATDLMVGKRLARYLILNAKKFGLDYVIFQDRIRNPDERAGESYWRQVGNWRRDNYNNGDCVNTHFDHIHASVYRGNGWAASTPKPDLNPDGKPW